MRQEMLVTVCKIIFARLPHPPPPNPPLHPQPNPRPNVSPDLHSKLIAERLVPPQIWLMAAQFELRQEKLDSARKIMGTALGLCPKDKLFTAYIELEERLGNIERCRALYGKYLEWRPENCRAWCKWIGLEEDLGETERCRAMLELAIQMPVLDMPELLWKV